jgi:hypothetical protein
MRWELSGWLFVCVGWSPLFHQPYQGWDKNLFLDELGENLPKRKYARHVLSYLNLTALC